jgi:dihydroorotate dehydrogenase electron transfer subunit
LAKLRFFADIVMNREIAMDIFHMKLYCPMAAKLAIPGQFLHMRCSDTLSPLLRRPISIANADERDGTLDIIYRVVGEGTRLLSAKKTGESIDIMGPLGNGYPIDQKVNRIAIIGGGIGTCPLMFLAKKLATKNSKSGNLVKHSVFLGFKTAKQSFGIEFFQSLGYDVHISTDDGSLGFKGFPTDLIQDYIFDVIYACGPKPLLAIMQAYAVRHNIMSFVSLEERMACGIGACLGCAVKMKSDGYKKVCKDGPVFELSKVIF